MPERQVIIGAYSAPHEAHVLGSELEDSGLDAVVVDRHAIDANGYGRTRSAE
jgi:hypothetical protein